MSWYFRRAYQPAPYPWWWKINPVWWFQNAQDPEPPSWFNARQRHWLRVLMWYLRNPLHNFHWYVIGIADRSFWRWGRQPEHNWAVSPSRWNWFITFAYGWLPLPFVSWRGTRIEWLFGWKDSGNFGAALRRASGPEGPTPRRAMS